MCIVECEMRVLKHPFMVGMKAWQIHFLLFCDDAYMDKASLKKVIKKTIRKELSSARSQVQPAKSVAEKKTKTRRAGGSAHSDKRVRAEALAREYRAQGKGTWQECLKMSWANINGSASGVVRQDQVDDGKSPEVVVQAQV